MSERANEQRAYIDRGTGISIRFVQQYDVEAEQRSMPPVSTEQAFLYAGRLTDTDWYPARVCSGRERLGE